MTHELIDLVIDRVDLVDEGANSAAFIELYKRKETPSDMTYEDILSKMKPEHAEVIKGVIAEAQGASTKLTEDNEALSKRVTELEEAVDKAKREGCAKSGCEKSSCEGCNDYEKAAGTGSGASFDETESMLKSMPEAARKLFEKMRADKEAAEEQVRKSAEEKAEAEAVAKAASLKALPVEQAKLVAVIKSCPTDVVDMLTAINAAIESTVLDEVGKNAGNGAAKTAGAWEALEHEADEVAKSRNVTKEKAMAIVMKEKPTLYHEYLKEEM